MAMNMDKKGLVPTPTGERPLAGAQQTFRNLLARVEPLRESIDAEEEKLDATLSFYATEIVPRLARKAALQKELVRALSPYMSKTSFPRRQARLEMKELIQELLAEIGTAEKGLTDPDIREIYDAVHNIGYAEHERRTLAN